MTYEVVVFGEQHRLIASTHRSSPPIGPGGLDLGVDLRQVNDEASALPSSSRVPCASDTVHTDVAAVLLDDAVTGGKAEARAVPQGLAGIKRLEQVLESLLAQAFAGVLHGEQRKAPAGR